MKKQIRKFEDLLVWQKAHKFVLKVYEKQKSFTEKESQSIKYQLIRAAISVPTNISEGMGRNSKKELLYFLNISRGSNEECRYLIRLAYDLKYLNSEEYDQLNNINIEIGKMLNGLINSLRKIT